MCAVPPVLGRIITAPSSVMIFPCELEVKTLKLLFAMDGGVIRQHITKTVNKANVHLFMAVLLRRWDFFNSSLISLPAAESEQGKIALSSIKPPHQFHHHRVPGDG